MSKPTGRKVYTLEPGEYVMEMDSAQFVYLHEDGAPILKPDTGLEAVKKELPGYVEKSNWLGQGFVKVRANDKPTPVDSLARALFRTDPEVLAYCKLRGDAEPQRAMDVCWKLDDRGFKSRCMERAAAMVEVLK